MADKALNRDTSQLDSTTWDHRWGFRDTKMVVQPDECVIMTGSRYNLCGYPMPYLIPFVREELGFGIDFTHTRPLTEGPYVSPVNRNEGFLAGLAAAFREDQVSVDDRERLIRSHGQTTTDEVSRVLYGNLHRTVDVVVWPESEEDCVAVVNLACEHDVCLIPYGGGTNVSDALQIPEAENRMVVSLDMRRMNAIEWVDADNFTACVQAGIVGSRLEERLEQDGFTCGHEPDSMELSTLGGWIATNASGMKRNRYGNIEDIVENLTLVTPSGVVENLYWTPRQAAGVEAYKAGVRQRGQPRPGHQGGDPDPQAAGGEAVRLGDLRRLEDRGRVHGRAQPDRRQAGQHQAGGQRPVPARPGAQARPHRPPEDPHQQGGEAPRHQGQGLRPAPDGGRDNGAGG